MEQHDYDHESFYNMLLEAAGAVHWRINWQTRCYTHIDVTIEDMLGWPIDDWHTMSDWDAHIHPEDRDEVLSYFLAQVENGFSHELCYRTLTRQGDCRWIRNVVYVVHHDHKPLSVVGFMFDITPLKEVQIQLEVTKQEVAEREYKDPVTLVVNHSMFELMLEHEWSSAQRYQHELTVVMLGLDGYAAYQQHHGLLETDKLMKEMAVALLAASRAQDVVARWAESCFAVILPDISQQDSLLVAERYQIQLQHTLYEHRLTENPPLCLSIALGNVRPSDNESPRHFAKRVHHRLSDAQFDGGNCVVLEEA